MKREVTPPKVIVEACIGCERCIAVCPSYVLEMVKTKANVTRGEWCIGCGHCGAVCPSEAILHEAVSFEKYPKEGRASMISPEILERLLRERRSIRNYHPDPLSEEILKKVLDAGRHAPTGSNSQNVHYVVITSPDRIAQLREMTIKFYDKIFSRMGGRLGRFFLSLIAGRKTVEYLSESIPKARIAYEQMRQGKDRLFYHAPVVILTHAESWDSCSSFNCSVALYHCSLMAHTLGLGCCFNGILVNAVNHHQKIKGWLGIPSDHQCYAAMTLGYPDMQYPRLIQRHPPKARWR
jgi:nitroreductase/NAD-dependent dihydropyrimidine dehydrogenase PreA subunit